VRLALAVAGVFVLYVLAVNILLGGGRLGRALSGEPEKLRIEYTSASSWWPGRIHVEGLDLRVRDENVEWEAHVDRADATVALFELLSHRFHTRRIEADGVTFRMRLRREEGELTPDKAARLPAIDGFPALPIAGVPPLSSGGGPPFTVVLEGLDLRGVREVWLDAFRLTGDLAVRGGFTVAPGDHFTVTPSHVEVRAASLATGDDGIVGDVHGTIDARIDPVPQAEMKSQLLLRHVSQRSTLEGNVAGIAFLRHFLPPSVVPSGGEGTFRGTVVVEAGIATEETTSHLELGTAVFALEDGHVVSARSTIDVTTTIEGSGRTGHVAVALADVTLADGRPGKEGKPVARADAIALEAHLDGTDIAVTPSDFFYSWSAPKTTIDDLRVVDEAFGRENDFRIEWGKARVSSTGSGTMEGLEAHVATDGGMGMWVEGARASARVVAKMTAKVSYAARTVDLGGSTLELEGLAVGGSKPRNGWISKVRLDTAMIHATPPSVELAIATSASDGRPLIDLYGAMKDVSMATRAALAIIPDASIESMTANLTGACRIRVVPGAVALHGLDVRGASSRFRGEMTKRGEAKTGGFLLEAGPLSMGLELEGTGVRPVLVNAGAWFEARGTGSKR
jgi:hypothetical protein